jgi:hypothetical protein
MEWALLRTKERYFTGTGGGRNALHGIRWQYSALISVIAREPTSIAQIFGKLQTLSAVA